MLDDNGPNVPNLCFQYLDHYVSIRAENCYTENTEIHVTVWNLSCSRQCCVNWQCTARQHVQSVHTVFTTKHNLYDPGDAV